MRQHVACVEVEDAEALDRVMRHVGAQIVEQRLPVGEHRPVGDARLDQPYRDRLYRAQGRDRQLAHAGDARERRMIGGEHPAQPAELAQERLRGRLGIDARAPEREHEFEQLVIPERLAPAGRQPLAQPGAVAQGIGGGIGARSGFAQGEARLAHHRAC